MNRVILAGKRHWVFSEDVIVVGTSHQILEVTSFCNWERAKPSPINITALIFQGKNSTMKYFGFNLILIFVLILKCKALYYYCTNIEQIYVKISCMLLKTETKGHCQFWIIVPLSLCWLCLLIYLNSQPLKTNFKWKP